MNVNFDISFFFFIIGEFWYFNLHFLVNYNYFILIIIRINLFQLKVYIKEVVLVHQATTNVATNDGNNLFIFL